MVEDLRSTAAPAPAEPGGRGAGRRRPGARLDRDRRAHRAALRGLGTERHHGRGARRRPGRLRDRVRAAPRPAAAARARHARPHGASRSSVDCAASAPSGPAVDLGGLTAFEQAVLRKTMEIPFGEVRPYAWIAREIERPRAVRAVGSALAGNPVPFVIPCHRVVRTDGHIGEYGAGGPEAKREVLGVEGVDTAALERLAASGHALHGQRHDPHLLLPVLPARPTHHAGPRGPLPHRPRRPGRRATTPVASADPWRPRPSRPEGPRPRPEAEAHLPPCGPPGRGHHERRPQRKASSGRTAQRSTSRSRSRRRGRRIDSESKRSHSS